MKNITSNEGFLSSLGNLKNSLGKYRLPTSLHDYRLSTYQGCKNIQIQAVFLAFKIVRQMGILNAHTGKICGVPNSSPRLRCLRFLKQDILYFEILIATVKMARSASNFASNRHINFPISRPLRAF